MANMLRVSEGIPDTFKSLGWVASGAQVVWTPAATKRFRLMRFIIGLTSDAAFAVAAGVPIILADAGTGSIIPNAPRFFIPGAAGALVGEQNSGWIDLGNGYLSAIVGASLTVNIGLNALTGGTAWVITAGTEE